MRIGKLTIAEELLIARRRKGITVGQMAEVLKVNIRFVSEFETGDLSALSFDKIQEYRKYIGSR